ncbi:GntR family transcriptional regulator [Paenibacillus eucommiae]|uniref:DNA-binding GntR family transcriptional regulator n=1 Tax=Paenibacillus eucommiae TaxID=1355755 RepID=A0ABS4IPF4_9BACL|nr:GntR family transcriptional regulator [Paenibacillus eucommiae]MBP1989438.1 DNA-binding GntR family transcriptional regulator [Paenibacillus eucommiae]
MTSFTFNQQSNISLREKVTNDIRNAILKGELQPGSRLKEIDIAVQMGVSRGPIREAIRQLEREGLLITYPYKETVVADIDVEEVKDILIPIRFHLEWYVIKKYIHQMNEAFFDQMQQIIESMDVNLKENNRDRLVELDVQFHETIIGLAPERTVILTWKSILNQTRLHFIKNVGYHNNDKIVKDHQALLDKLITKDLELIQQELQYHMEGEESFLFS